jgi:hypothetical protein
MAPHTGVNYRVKRERQKRERLKSVCPSPSPAKKRRKKNIGVPAKDLASDQEIPTRVGNIFFLSGQKILVGY